MGIKNSLIKVPGGNWSWKKTMWTTRKHYEIVSSLVCPVCKGKMQPTGHTMETILFGFYPARCLNHRKMLVIDYYPNYWSSLHFIMLAGVSLFAGLGLLTLLSLIRFWGGD